MTVSPTWTSLTTLSPVAMYPTSPGAERCDRVMLGIEEAEFEEFGLLAVRHQPMRSPAAIAPSTILT